MDRKTEDLIIHIFDELKSFANEKMTAIEAQDEEDKKIPPGFTYWDGHLVCSREYLELIHQLEQEFVEERLAEETQELTEETLN